MDGQSEYLASFPGVHFREWGRVTLVMIGKSVACVFVPGGSLLYGNHDEDPDHPGKCFCQSFLCAPRVEYTPVRASGAWSRAWCPKSLRPPLQRTT